MAKKPSFRDALFQQQQTVIDKFRADFAKAVAIKDPCLSAMALDELEKETAENITLLKNMLSKKKDSRSERALRYIAGSQLATILNSGVALAIGASTGLLIPVFFGTMVAGGTALTIKNLLTRKELKAIKDCTAQYLPEVEKINTDVQQTITDKIKAATLKKSALFASPHFKKIGDTNPRLSKQFLQALTEKKDNKNKNTDYKNTPFKPD